MITNKEMRASLTAEYLNDCFHYENGRLFWKIRPREHFNSDLRHIAFNRRYANTEAFVSVNTNHGYNQGGLDGIKLLRSYVVYLMHTGKHPTRSIKHKNGIRSDDNIENLHEAGSDAE